MPDSDNTPTQDSQNTQQASANQNANTTMLVAMGCILLLGLAAVLIFKKKDTSSEGELNALREKVRQQELTSGHASDPLASAAEVEARLKTIKDNADKLQGGFANLKNDLATTSEALQQARSANQAQQNVIANNAAQITGLRQQISQLNSLAGNASLYQKEVQKLQNQIFLKDQQIAQLQARPSKESLSIAESDLQDAKASKAQLSDELAILKQQMLNMVSADKLSDLERQTTNLRTENEELRQQLQALRTKLDFARLFIKSHEQLPAKASALFKELQTLEGKKPDQLAAAYTRINSVLKADNLRQVKFATGSSLVNFTDQANIRNTLGTTRANDYFLVVGYASKTGDAASNETLSANRATAVASIVNMLKQEGQDVRAVYLGQTNRFSTTKAGDNQLCEIWRIRE